MRKTLANRGVVESNVAALALGRHDRIRPIQPPRGRKRFALIASNRTATNTALRRAGGAAWQVLSPHEAIERLTVDDVAIGRLDVLPTLDGVDNGLWALSALEARGVTVLNGAGAMLAAHDKLLTARLLAGAGIPHPSTRLYAHGDPLPEVTTSVVVKPRFGSWGRDIARCSNQSTLSDHLDSLADREWFQRHGALIQALVRPRGYDLRILVAAGQVAGAVIRVSPDGEWRTNVSLGAQRVPTVPPPDAARLALAAAEVTGAQLVGVDLLPTPRGGWVILEVNGAVDFNEDYAREHDVFDRVVALLRAGAGRARASAVPIRGIHASL